MKLSITVFGLGKMGRPISHTLIAAGWQVQGWNRSPPPQELVQGIPQCPQLAEAAKSDVCLFMLSDSTAVDQVMDRLEPYLSPGQIVLDMGSSEPARSSVHARRLTAKGIGWVDAPVSGGPGGAAAGTLAIMAGGSQVDFERVRPILEVLGGNVVRVGGPGAGHIVKIINQVIVGLTIEAVAEALTLAEQAGVELRLVQEALREGWADSKILQHHGTRMRKRKYEPGAFVSTQLKDLRMAQKIASAQSLQLPHLESTIQMYETLVGMGNEKLDHSALHKLISSSGQKGE